MYIHIYYVYFSREQVFAFKKKIKLLLLQTHTIYNSNSDELYTRKKDNKHNLCYAVGRQIYELNKTKKIELTYYLRVYHLYFEMQNYFTKYIFI